MKRWLIVTGGGILAAALLALPPWEMPRWRMDLTPPERVARQLGSEIGVLNGTLQRVRIGDSLRALVSADPEAATGVAVGHVSGLEMPTRLRVAEAAFREEVAALPGRAEEVLLGLYTVPHDQGHHPELNGGSFLDELEWYAGRLEDGRSYCLAAVGVDPGAADRLYYLRPPDGGSRVGPCAPWARFGHPGPAVERWLAAGGAYYTVGREVPGTVRGGLAEARRRPFRRDEGRRYLTPAMERCLTGAVDTCAGLLTLDREAPGLVRGDLPAWSLEASRRHSGFLGRMRWSTTALGHVGPVLLADLERQFGPDRVRDFWTSDSGTVEGAFREAFGVEPGEWTRSWLAGYAPSFAARSRALPTPTTALSIALVLGLAAGVAVGTARRREVG